MNESQDIWNFLRVFQKFSLFIPLIMGAPRTMFCGTPNGKHRCRIYAPQIILLYSCIIFTSQSYIYAIYMQYLQGV